MKHAEKRFSPQQWSNQHTTMSAESNIGKWLNQQILENEYVVSADPVAYCYKDVLVWAPEKLVQGGLKSLCCWDPTCAGHSQTTTKGKTIISIHDVEIRRVDGLEDFLFIIFAKYECKICHRYKSGLELDALAAMGVTMSVLYTIPVIPFHDSCFTKQLADLVLEMMISPSGSYRTFRVV